MYIEETPINDSLRVSKVSWNFWVPAIYNFAVIDREICYSWKVVYFLTISFVFPVYKQNFKGQ